MYPEHKLPNKFVVEFDAFRKLTRLERLKILLGYNLLGVAKCVIQRRQGNAYTKLNIQLTKQTTSAGQIRENPSIT